MPIGIYLHKTGKKANRYIDGRATKKYYCKDCGKKINLNTALYSSGKCKKCIRKGKRIPKEIRRKIKKTLKGHLNWFKKHTKTSKEKLSKAHMGKKLSRATKNKLRKLNLGKKQSKKTIIKREKTINKHHIDLNIKNNKEANILSLPKKKHIKLHYQGYRYLVEKGLVRKYIKWFDKKYGIL